MFTSRKTTTLDRFVEILGILGYIHPYGKIASSVLKIVVEATKEAEMSTQPSDIDIIKAFVRDEGNQIINHFNQVALAIHHQQHHLQIQNAYGIFKTVIDQQLPAALTIQNQTNRNHQLSLAQNNLFLSLSTIDNPEILSSPSIKTKYHRRKCGWEIRQAIAFNNLLQNNLTTCIHELDNLINIINQDCEKLIDACQCQEDLDFLFPAITQTRHQDLVMIDFWKQNIKKILLIHSLPNNGKEQPVDVELPEIVQLPESERLTALNKSPEEFYKNLKKKSHYSALQDQLKFIVKPELRRHHESYIQEQAIAQNRQGLIPNNWQEVPDFTVANLYYYLKNSDPPKSRPKRKE